MDVLADVSLMVRWSAAIALETAYASVIMDRSVTTPQLATATTAALDWLHNECLTRAWMLGWEETDLPLPPGNLP